MPKLDPDEVRPTGSFTARYPGRCHAECGEPIEPGDTVRYDEVGLVHEDCLTAPVVAAVACKTCWLVGPCDCD